jgi:hypothetical protein
VTHLQQEPPQQQSVTEPAKTKCPHPESPSYWTSPAACKSPACLCLAKLMDVVRKVVFPAAAQSSCSTSCPHPVAGGTWLCCQNPTDI